MMKPEKVRMATVNWEGENHESLTVEQATIAALPHGISIDRGEGRILIRPWDKVCCIEIFDRELQAPAPVVEDPFEEDEITRLGTPVVTGEGLSV